MVEIIDHFSERNDFLLNCAWDHEQYLYVMFWYKEQTAPLEYLPLVAGFYEMDW